MAKILLVGGAGYVGSVLAEELLEHGYAVKILDRLYYGDAGLRPIRDRVELHVGDMRQVDPALLADVDVLINVGGLSNDPTAEYNPRANREMNTVATQTLAELCKRHGVRRYIFASSCSVYDRGVGREQQDILQDETTEVHPLAAYSSSKYEAERRLIEMADTTFCPVILRKGTVFGFSPRMRFDLVVNTFVKDALSTGMLTLHHGGEMWRPLVDVRDVARAYLACVQAEEAKVRAEIFNVAFQNVRISELALRVREALRSRGVAVEIRPDYAYHSVRSYRVSARKIERVLGVQPTVTIEAAVADMVDRIRRGGLTDYDNPRYYNIQWLRMLEEAERVLQGSRSVFDLPGDREAEGQKVVGWPGSRAATGA